jgi:ubiquinone/menaquinone biosynthesis C-methylase UbiE
MIPRVLEPEIMDTAEDARDYDAMDHLVVNEAFCEDFVKAIEGESILELLDVGTGTARIPIALCTHVAGANFIGIDLAESMLAVGRENVNAAGLGERITLEARDAKQTHWPHGQFDAVMSNSIVHHIPEPIDALAEMWRLVREGGVLFIRDLRRPIDVEELARLVTRHGGAPSSNDPKLVASHARQKRLFAASLHAALSTDEVQVLAARIGIDADAISATGDRHWTLSAIKQQGHGHARRYRAERVNKA